MPSKLLARSPARIRGVIYGKGHEFGAEAETTSHASIISSVQRASGAIAACGSAARSVTSDGER
jgi:hypothetical protein